jgi:integrase
MDGYLEVLDVDVTTRRTYESYIRLHVRPLLGKLPLAKLGGETLDAFYSILRKCRAQCNGRPFVEHVVDGEHQCPDRCRPHQCRPLAASSIRQIHFCLSGALRRAVSWQWINVNPFGPGGAAAFDPA